MPTTTMSSMTEEERKRLKKMQPDQMVPQTGGARPLIPQTGGPRPMGPPDKGPGPVGSGTITDPKAPTPTVISDPGPMGSGTINEGSRGLLQARQDYSDDINALFQQYVGRDAAQSGLDYWQQVLNDGATLDDLRFNLAGSDEAYGVANQRVQDAFQGLLGREARQAGLDYWRGDLLSGKTVDDLNYNIRQSPEFGNRVTSEVGIAFSQFLERSPSAEEISSLVSAARAGQPLEEILANIQNSPEAQAIAQRKLAEQALAAAKANQIAPTQQSEVETGSQTSASQAAEEVATYDPALAAESGTAEANEAEVTARQVTPQQTVQYQLNQILNSNSPLLQSARTRGLQYANQRGLLNSSIAAQASEQAVIDAATRIAEQDAATYAGADAQSVDAANRAALQDASLGTNVSMFNVGEGNVTNRFNADSINQAGAFNADAANTAIQAFLTREAQRLLQDDQQLFTAEQNEADRTLRKYLQEQEFDFTSSENALDRELQSVLQENQFAFTRGESALDRDLQTSLQQSQFDFTGTQNQLDRDLASQEAALDRALQTALQESNFEFTGDQNALDRALKQALQNEQLTWTGDQNQLDRALQTSLQNSQLASNEAIAAAKIAAEQALQETQLAFSGTQAQLDRDFQMAFQNNAQSFQATQLATQHAFASMEAEKQRGFESYLQTSQNDWAAQQNALDREFKKYQVNAQSASTIMYSAMDGIAAIYADPNLTVYQKEQATANLMTVTLQMPGLMQNITDRMEGTTSGGTDTNTDGGNTTDGGGGDGTDGGDGGGDGGDDGGGPDPNTNTSYTTTDVIRRAPPRAVDEAGFTEQTTQDGTATGLYLSPNGQRYVWDPQSEQFVPVPSGPLP